MVVFIGSFRPDMDGFGPLRPDGPSSSGPWLVWEGAGVEGTYYSNGTVRYQRDA